MSYKYNAYLRLTKEYLRNLVYYVEALKNISQELDDIESELGGVSIRTSGGSAIGAGGENMSCVEREAAGRMMRLDRYKELYLDRVRLLSQVQKIKDAVAKLPDDEQEAVKLFYCDHLGYEGMARCHHYSERTCKRRVFQATRKIAFMLFGSAATRNIAFI